MSRPTPWAWRCETEPSSARSLSAGPRSNSPARQEGDRRRLVVLLCLTALGVKLVDVPQALAHAEEAVAILWGSPATSTLIFPLFQLSMVLSALPTETDRCLVLAEECIDLDRTYRRAWSTLAEATAAKLRVENSDVASGLHFWRTVFSRLDRSGDVGYLASQLYGAAEGFAPIDPAFPRRPGGHRRSLHPSLQSLSSIGSRKGRTSPPRVHDLGPTAVDAARSRRRRDVVRRRPSTHLRQHRPSHRSNRLTYQARDSPSDVDHQGQR